MAQYLLDMEDIDYVDFQLRHDAFNEMLIELKEYYENHNEEYKAQFFKYIVKIVRNHILLASA